MAVVMRMGAALWKCGYNPPSSECGEHYSRRTAKISMRGQRAQRIADTGKLSCRGPKTADRFFVPQFSKCFFPLFIPIFSFFSFFCYSLADADNKRQVGRGAAAAAAQLTSGPLKRRSNHELA
ncbi:hypothetical protein L1887_50247 [Cichorium endivia]|nr:hypothetical protein L1887_50247 [Cichorium endivia]